MHTERQLEAVHAGLDVDKGNSCTATMIPALPVTLFLCDFIQESSPAAFVPVCDRCRTLQDSG